MTEPTKPDEPTEPTDAKAAKADAKAAKADTKAAKADAKAAKAEAKAEAKAARVPRFRRVRALFAPLAPVGRVLSKIPHPSLKSRRGVFVLFCLVAGFGAVATIGGVMAVH